MSSAASANKDSGTGSGAQSGDQSGQGDSTGQEPNEFAAAKESMHAATLRPELSIGPIRPPQRLAPYSYAIGYEVDRTGLLHDDSIAPIDVPESNGYDAFGRLILLYDPRSEDWKGDMRLVAYIQADIEADVANDPFLPEVAWQWLHEGLDDIAQQGKGHGYSHLGGTVTSTTSARYGDIGGPAQTHQIELRASWTAEGHDLSHHVEAFGQVLSNVAGLPPEGVTELQPR